MCCPSAIQTFLPSSLPPTPLAALGALLHNRKSRDFGSGTTGGKAVRRHRVRWLLAAATQVSLAVAATAVYVIASRVQGRMQRQSVRAPTNLWDRLLSSSSR